jgi:hypothetical protein
VEHYDEHVFQWVVHLNLIVPSRIGSFLGHFGFGLVSLLFINLILGNDNVVLAFRGYTLDNLEQDNIRHVDWAPVDLEMIGESGLGSFQPQILRPQLASDSLST